MISVYQAEWCPHSALIRQRLTELDVSYVAIPVAPDHGDRSEMIEATGSETIPTVVLDDGTVLAGANDAILRGLDERFPEGPRARAHREAAHAHGSIAPG